jgi:hypothetical protein
MSVLLTYMPEMDENVYELIFYLFGNNLDGDGGSHVGSNI